MIKATHNLMKHNFSTLFPLSRKTEDIWIRRPNKTEEVISPVCLQNKNELPFIYPSFPVYFKQKQIKKISNTHKNRKPDKCKDSLILIWVSSSICIHESKYSLKVFFNKLTHYFSKVRDITECSICSRHSTCSVVTALTAVHQEFWKSDPGT